MKNTEIEIQVKVENIKSLVRFLNKHGKQILKTQQIDEYFVPKHRNFLNKKPIFEWLRLRNDNGNYSINYKYWHYDRNGKSHHADEYETGIDNIDQLNLIFKSLNLKSVVKVDKKRTTYRYKSYEISIDRISGLGDFVEIEYKGRSRKSPKEIADNMSQFLKDLKVGKIYRNYVGYPFQILFPKKVKWEEI